jgi:hypothetical protein
MKPTMLANVMKLKPYCVTCILLGIALMVAWNVTTGQTNETSSKGNIDTRGEPVSKLFDEVNSIGSAMFELAGERYAANEKRQVVWIMTLHDPRWTASFEVLKITDGKITVVALPIMGQNAETGLRRYVDHYNSYNIKAADLMVKAAKYDEAYQLYRLLLRHDSGSSFADEIRLRLGLLEKIKSGEDLQKNLAQFLALYTNLSPSFLVGLHSVEPTVVTNLFVATIRDAVRKSGETQP